MPDTPSEGDLPGLEPDVDEAAARIPSEVAETVDPVDQAIDSLGDSLGGYGSDDHAAVDDWFENEYGGHERLNNDTDRIRHETGSKDPNDWPESGFRDLMQVMWAVNTSSYGDNAWTSEHHPYRPGQLEWTEERRQEIRSRRAPGTDWHSENRSGVAGGALKAFHGDGMAAGMASWDAVATLEEKLAFQQWATLNGFSGKGSPRPWWSEWLQRIKDYWQLIALGLLGALGTLAVLTFLFQYDGPDPSTPDVLPPALQQTADGVDQQVEGPEEPLSSSELVEADALIIDTSEALTAYSECPDGFQMDITGRRMSGKDSEQREPDAETNVDRAGNNTCNRYRVHSHEFTMIVEGDGESLSKEDHTSYQVFFIVNNEWPDNVYYDDTGFTVLVQWNHLAKQYTDRLSDSGFAPIKDASVDIEWLDASTLQVIVELPGDEVEVTEVRTEVVVYISDANDNYVYDSHDIAIWTAEQ